MVNEEIYVLTKHAKFQSEYIENIPVYRRRYFLYLFEKEMEELKKTFIHGQLIEIKDAGHWIHADQPMKLLGVIKTFFL